MLIFDGKRHLSEKICDWDRSQISLYIEGGGEGDDEGYDKDVDNGDGYDHDDHQAPCAEPCFGGLRGTTLAAYTPMFLYEKYVYLYQIWNFFIF